MTEFPNSLMQEMSPLVLVLYLNPIYFNDTTKSNTMQGDYLNSFLKNPSLTLAVSPSSEASF